MGKPLDSDSIVVNVFMTNIFALLFFVLTQLTVK